VELLAPAGGPAQFAAALAAGADAIYCAPGTLLNARRGAHNFDEEGFASACHAAHVLGVRVYVTANVAVTSGEMARALQEVRRAWVLGADALIIQDLGLLSEVRRRWPQIETHVSTQMNVHDRRGVAWVRDTFGVERVTLSRELSLYEITEIAREGVDLEVFGHGALCFCYSGVCELSSSTGRRSANRGLCAQPCRMPYDLVDAHGRVRSAPGRRLPLCPKDCCTVADLDELARVGVRSLKVEGRMKAADYVWSVVRAYRAELDERGLADDAGTGTPPAAIVAEGVRERGLRRAFNRDFTDAYLHGRSGDEMMSYERSNNRGELVGEVVDARRLPERVVTRGGEAGGRIRLRHIPQAELMVALSAPVDEGDLLEMRPVDDPERYVTGHVDADAAAGECVSVRVARTVALGSPVRLIRSQRAIDEAAHVAKVAWPRTRPVWVRVTARLGVPLTLRMGCCDAAGAPSDDPSEVVEVTGAVVERARTRAVTVGDLREHVGRMGSTPFRASSIEVELDEGCGMGFSAVHRLRAEACERLEEALLAAYVGRENEAAEAPTRRQMSGIYAAMARERAAAVSVAADALEVCAVVRDVASAAAAAAASARRIYVWGDAWGGHERELVSLGVEVVPVLDEVCREADHERIDGLVRGGRAVAVGNLSELALAAQRGAAAEVRPCVPVHNGSCAVALERAGASALWLSDELSIDEVREVAAVATVPVGLVVLGRRRAMTSEHCVLKVADRCVGDCSSCGLRRERLFLRAHDGGLLPVETDARGRSRIYAARPLDLLPHLGEVLQAGVRRVAADCMTLDAKETGAAVAALVRAVATVREGGMPERHFADGTEGHLLSGVQ